MSVILKNNQLILEPISVVHIDGLWPHMSNPKITTFLAWPPHKKKYQTEAVVKALIQGQMDGKGIHWVIHSGKEICGLISIIDLCRTHMEWQLNRGELAFWVAPSFAGQGIATMASQMVLDYVFLEKNLHKIIIAHASNNKASARVIKKMGCKYVGEFTDAFCKEGIWYNLKYYEWLAKEWLVFKNKAE